MKKGRDGTYTPAVSHLPKLPLTGLQQRWLKSIIADRRISLFLSDSDLAWAGELLKDTEPLFDEEDFYYFDRFKDGDELFKVLEILTASYGYAWSPKRITVSTIGVAKGLKRFLEESDCHLAVSLHSPYPGLKLSTGVTLGAILVWLGYCGFIVFVEKKKKQEKH